MTTKDIADRLVTLCRQNKFEEAQKELYSEDIVSIEPKATPAFAKETKGLPAIIDKGHKFMSSVEKMYSSSVSEPIVAGDSFACTMSMDIKMKGQDRMNMSELCVYKVKAGKVISEEFMM